MAKKNKEKKSGVSGKMIFGVVLAVGSAVAAYVASKFFCKKGELAQPAPESDADTEMTEDNYITLENDVDSEPLEEEAAADEAANTEALEDAADEAVGAEDSAEAPMADDDAIKCIKD